MNALAVGMRNAEREAKRTDRANKQLELEKKRLGEGKAAAVAEKAAAMNAVQALTREIEWLRKQTEIEQQGLMKLIIQFWEGELAKGETVDIHCKKDSMSQQEENFK